MVSHPLGLRFEVSDHGVGVGSTGLVLGLGLAKTVVVTSLAVAQPGE